MPEALPKIVVILGPTSSGKSALAVRLAQRIGGEIVSADSRLIYRGMDIGTAKPTLRERGGVPHHLIDLVPPSRTLTLAQWKRKAVAAIRDVLRRGRIPVVVGGTGLYVQALVENMEIPEVPPDHAFRARLRKLSAERICNRLKRLDPEYAARIGPNQRYAIRALEVMRATGRRVSEIQRKGPPLFDALLIGLKPADAVLKRRIARRTAAMARAGLVEEVRRLARRHRADLPAMSGIGYREIAAHLKGETGLPEALEAVKAHTWQYARRQMTWFRRMKGIRWFSAPQAALKAASNWLK